MKVEIGKAVKFGSVLNTHYFPVEITDGDITQLSTMHRNIFGYKHCVAKVQNDQGKTALVEFGGMNNKEVHDDAIKRLAEAKRNGYRLS